MSRVRHTTQHAVAFAVVVRELLAGRCTALELAEETGMRHETILGWVRALKRHGAIHVASWVEDSNGRRSTACYALGDKPDAKRSPMAPIDIKRRYRQRAKQRAAMAMMKEEAA